MQDVTVGTSEVVVSDAGREEDDDEEEAATAAVVEVKPAETSVRDEDRGVAVSSDEDDDGLEGEIAETEKLVVRSVSDEVDAEAIAELVERLTELPESVQVSVQVVVKLV